MTNLSESSNLAGNGMHFRGGPASSNPSNGGNTSSLSDNGDGTYTHNDGAGNTENIDTRASSNPFDNAGTDLTSDNVNDAINEVNDKANIITSPNYILAGPENSITISGIGSSWEMISVEYDAVNEVSEPAIVVQARLANGTYAVVPIVTNVEDAVNDWKTINVTTEKFYFQITFPPLPNVLEYSVRVKTKDG